MALWAGDVRSTWLQPLYDSVNLNLSFIGVTTMNPKLGIVLFTVATVGVVTAALVVPFAFGVPAALITLSLVLVVCFVVLLFLSR